MSPARGRNARKGVAVTKQQPAFTMLPYEPTHLKRWKMPPNYMGEVWPDYYVFLGHHRDSDELSESNFAVAQKRLAALTPFDDEYSRQPIRESHWAVGWVEWLAIHADDTEALKAADEMAAGLDGYPVLDESDFGEREHESAHATHTRSGVDLFTL